MNKMIEMNDAIFICSAISCRITLSELINHVRNTSGANRKYWLQKSDELFKNYMNFVKYLCDKYSNKIVTKIIKYYCLLKKVPDAWDIVDINIEK